MAAPMSKTCKPSKDVYLAEKQGLENHFTRLADAVSNKCPQLSFYFITRSKLSQSSEKEDRKYFFERCPYCWNLHDSSNKKISLKPKLSFNNKIKKLINRQSTNPGSLGKFQTKRVQEYIIGRNKLTIQCHVCKKVRKLPGQSRLGRIRQNENLKRSTVQNIEPEELVTSNRQRKRKERKKVAKLKKREEKNEDVNAGLTITGTIGNGIKNDVSSRLNNSTDSTVSQNSSDSQQSTGYAKKENFTLPGTSNKTFVKQKAEKLSDQMTKIQNSFNEKGQNNSAKIHLDTIDKQQTGSLHKINSGKKFTQDKKKSKKIGQRLGNILKKEKKKESGGSLADFLSAL